MTLVVLSIVIVNFRSGQLVIDCLQSLADVSLTVRWSAIIIDNASLDGSADMIETAIAERGWGDFARVYRSARNGGFGAGNNIGIQTALRSAAPVIWLLNPDTLVRTDVIETVQRFLAERPAAGIVGTSLVDAAGKSDCAAHSDPSPLGELEVAAQLGVVSRVLRKWAVSPVNAGGELAVNAVNAALRPPYRCDWVSGASLLARRQVFEQIGGFDEGFFLYFEEVDLCRRARAAGWEVWHLPGTDVVHLEGSTTGINNSSRRRPFYWFKSRRRLFVKQGGVTRLLLADLGWSLGRCIRAVKVLVGGKARQDPPRFAWDLIVGDLRAVMQGRCGANAADNTLNPVRPLL